MNSTYPSVSHDSFNWSSVLTLTVLYIEQLAYSDSSGLTSVTLTAHLHPPRISTVCVVLYRTFSCLTHAHSNPSYLLYLLLNTPLYLLGFHTLQKLLTNPSAARCHTTLLHCPPALLSTVPDTLPTPPPSHFFILIFGEIINIWLIQSLAYLLIIALRLDYGRYVSWLHFVIAFGIAD